jgi:hypothetical protein
MARRIVLLLLTAFVLGAAASPAAGERRVIEAALVHDTSGPGWHNKLVVHARDLQPERSRMLVGLDVDSEFLNARARRGSGGRVWRLTPAMAHAHALIHALSDEIRSGGKAKGLLGGAPKSLPLFTHHFTLLAFNEFAPVGGQERH